MTYEVGKWRRHVSVGNQVREVFREQRLATGPCTGESVQLGRGGLIAPLRLMDKGVERPRETHVLERRGASVGTDGANEFVLQIGVADEESVMSQRCSTSGDSSSVQSSEDEALLGEVVQPTHATPSVAHVEAFQATVDISDPVHRDDLGGGASARQQQTYRDGVARALDEYDDLRWRGSEHLLIVVGGPVGVNAIHGWGLRGQRLR